MRGKQQGGRAPRLAIRPGNEKRARRETTPRNGGEARGGIPPIHVLDEGGNVVVILEGGVGEEVLRVGDGDLDGEVVACGVGGGGREEEGAGGEEKEGEECVHGGWLLI